MNSQVTKTNKLIVFTIAILSILTITTSVIPATYSYYKVKADNTAIAPTIAPTVAPTITAPVVAPVDRATTSNPAITGIKSTDTTITGTAPFNSTIEIKDGNGNVITCKNSPVTSDSNGNYSCQLNAALSTNTIVSVTATELGKNTSNPVNVSVSEGIVVPPPVSSSSSLASSAPAFSPFSIDGGLLKFNIPDGLKNALTPNQYSANLSEPALGDWKVNPGVAIPGLLGMVPLLAQKDENNYLSTFLSNQNPDITKKPTTRIVLDQAALDSASGVIGFKPVEVGGISDLVRIPNLSTPATDDWWYVPKSSIEPNGYQANANDVTNFNTPEATIGFYKGNPTTQVTPTVNETLPYSFVLEGTPASYGPSNAFALNAKATSPENLGSIDNLVKGSTFDNSGFKFELPKLNLPKIALPGINLPEVTKNKNWWDLWWIIPLLFLLALLAFLWWLLSKIFGWGVKEDINKYSQTYTGVNNNFKKTKVNYQANNAIDKSTKLKTTYSDDFNIKKTNDILSTVQTQSYVAPIVEEVKHTSTKYEAPKFDAAPKYVAAEADEVSYAAPKYQAPKYEAPIVEKVSYIAPKSEEIIYESSTYDAPKAKTQSPAALAAAAAAMGIAKNTYDNVTTSSTKTSTNVTKHLIHKDDLKIVEGIGPVIERNLHDAGVLTYQDLANTTEAKIEKILAPITNNFTVFNCSTWAEQAQLAADGKFDELDKLKDILDKGVRR
jgi:predicted flap endonuclease-1-like 5' DNA nuclease